MAEEKFDTPSLEENAFEALEKDFQEVISLLKGDKSLEKFQTEYEKLHAVLKNSRENEKRLMEKCRELNAELVVNSSKVATLTRLSKEDRETMTSVKTELEKTWEMVDTAHEKEQKTKEMIKSLQEEISHLTNLVEQGSGPSMEQEHNIQDLLKLQEEITKERDQLLSEVVELRQSLTLAAEQQQETERLKTEADQSIIQLEEEIQMHQNEASQEALKKERMEKDLKDVLAEMSNKQAEIKNLEQHVQRNKEEQQKLEEHLKEQKTLNEKVGKELEQFQRKNSKLMQEKEERNVVLEEMVQDTQRKTAELKSREDEMTQMRLEISKLNKARDVLQNKLRVAEEEKVDAGHERNTLKNKISGLEREMEATKKQVEIDKKAINELVRERDMLSKNLLKATNAAQQQVNLMKLHEQSKRNLEQEIQSYKNEAQKQRKIVYQLEKERDGFINETSELKQKVLQHLKDIEIQEMQISDYEKIIAESTIELKQQKNSYETMKTERNLYNKNLNEAKDEIAETKEKLKTATREVEQLKEDIAEKEAALAKAHLEHQQIEKEIHSLKDELHKMEKQALETKHFIENQEAEERRLLKIIAEADAERLKQKRECEQVINERDILGSLLSQRDDEVALLYEKIKVQQSVLNRGEIQYQQRMEDIRLLKLEIKKLHREKGVLGKSVADVEKLRQEVHQVQTELVREQARCKILEKEVENPMNVHRWRKLKANDPNAYELIQKIQRLQKQLISKTDEVIEKKLLLQAKEKLYVDLKRVLARQPGPEVTKQLQLYQHTLREKTKQLKVLSSELNMYKSESQEYKYEIERLGKELLNVKKKYLAQKRKEQQAKDKEQLLADTELEFPRHDSLAPRFTGGDFGVGRALPKITA